MFFVMPILPPIPKPRGWKPESYRITDTREVRDRAKRNHSQTLERLAERGGLSWTELYAVLMDKGLFDVRHDQQAKDKAREYLRSIEPPPTHIHVEGQDDGY